MAKDPQTRIHKEWLGLLQPVGLVVAPPALAKAQAIPNQNVVEHQKRLKALVERPDADPVIDDYVGFFTRVLGWEEDDLVGRPGGPEIPKDLEVGLPEYEDLLAPTYVVPDPDASPKNDQGKSLMLVKTVRPDQDLDDAGPYTRKGWHASPQLRFERLLRETEVHLGLLCNGYSIRIVYAPPGESSGHLTFPIKAMTEVSGRPILAALRMLLEADRLFTLSADRRLPAILSDSRKYQNEVSTALSEQVLRALGELLRGFQAADEASGGELLGDVVREEPQRVYGGLTTTLLRMVFLLYAEERGLMPDDPVYVEHYSVSGLFGKLRHDAGLYPDTMDQRYGAWTRLISLFRLVFDGASHSSMHVPTRHGQLFHPDEYPFLEGRPHRSVRQLDERIKPPRISDGVVFRVLEDLLMLDGERLSYRTLDVEQIGSVYEAIMGFEVERAKGPSIAVRPGHVVVDLEGILNRKPGARAKSLKETGCELTAGGKRALAAAKTVDEVVASLGNRISPQTRDPAGNPIVLATGSLYLQPTEERRRQGAHYTPRSLTEPIVRSTLQGVLAELGERPTPEQILHLKVCDPAMGSGAFLVETCRHLADKLVDAWNLRNQMPELPPDEDAILHARRLVAQRCLYGVDKNPFAVSLAKLSLWLFTLAKDHSFTFLDHSLKHGDSLVGLGRKQIAAFHWKPDRVFDDTPLFAWLVKQIGKARLARTGILELGDGGEQQKRENFRHAEEEVADARMAGDLVVAAYFLNESGRAREALRLDLWTRLSAAREGDAPLPALGGVVEELRPLVPFHWEIEFPEVFDREEGGFDAFVANPPYINAVQLYSGSKAKQYKSYYKGLYAAASGSYDIYVLFVERLIALARPRGSVGLLLPNKLLSAEYAREIRAHIVSRCRISSIVDVSQRADFSASVYPIVLVVEAERADVPAQVFLSPDDPAREVPQETFRRAPDLLWGYVLTEYSDLVGDLLADTERLDAVATVTGAATVAEAYEIKEHVVPGNGSVPAGHFKFVVSGNIRPFSTTWESADVRYLKDSYSKPTIARSALPLVRAEQSASPKMILSGMALRPTAFFDQAGEYCAGKSTVLVREKDAGVSLESLCSLLNSRVAALIYKALYGGLAMAGGYFRFGPPQIAAFPVPRKIKEAGGPLTEAEIAAMYGVSQSSVEEHFVRNFSGDL